MRRRNRSLRSYVTRGTEANGTNLIPSSILSDDELFVCIYYFYYFCILCEDIRDTANCYSFFWYIVRRYKKEEQLADIVAELVSRFEKEGWLTLRDEEEFNDKTPVRFFPNTNIEIKYKEDFEIWKEDISLEIIGMTVSKCVIDFYRCIKAYIFDRVLILGKLIRHLFIEPALLEKNRKNFDIYYNPNYNLHIEDFKVKYANALKNLDKVQFLIDMVGISEQEARFLLILYRCNTISELAQIYTTNLSVSANIVTAILEINTKEFNMLTHRNSMIRTYGFINKDGMLEPDLKDCITTGNIDLFFADFIQDLDCSKAFDCKSFSVPEETTTIMKRFINGKRGASILLYGKPGSGKTEYAKALLKDSNRRIVIFKNETELDGINKALLRLNCYLSMKGNSTILVVDEADKLLQTKDGNSFMGIIPNAMKGTVNKMLENSDMKTIWIVNYSNQIDVSTKRRFSYSCRFEAMTEKQLRAIAASKLHTLHFEEDIETAILDLLGKYRITGSSVDNSIAIANDMRELNKDTLLSTVENILQENSQLIYGKKTMRQIVGEEYDLSVLNTSISAEQIVEMTQNAMVYAERHENANNGIRMLFYGLSGTGKTELAHYISQKLGKDLLLKRASDIFGMFVGENERNIRQAFEEAESTDSILLFDEADSFFADRADAQRSWERTIVNEFLTQMEEYKGILICTTNLKNIMDSAMLRRFHFCVEFKPLKQDGIETMLDKYFPEYQFTSREIKNLEESGSVTPGDFGSLSSRIRFMNQDSINSAMIISELINLQKEKKNSKYTPKVGFSFSA